MFPQSEGMCSLAGLRVLRQQGEHTFGYQPGCSRMKEVVYATEPSENKEHGTDAYWRPAAR